MIRQCFLANTGIRFHAELLRSVGLDPASLYPVVRARPEAAHYAPGAPLPDGAGGARLTEEEEDLADALCPLYDQLARTALSLRSVFEGTSLESVQTVIILASYQFYTCRLLTFEPAWKTMIFGMMLGVSVSQISYRRWQ